MGCWDWGRRRKGTGRESYSSSIDSLHPFLISGAQGNTPRFESSTQIFGTLLGLWLNPQGSPLCRKETPPSCPDQREAAGYGSDVGREPKVWEELAGKATLQLQPFSFHPQKETQRLTCQTLVTGGLGGAGRAEDKGEGSHRDLHVAVSWG